jgi:tetratricopeptide (TPR) repeat protein
MKTIFLICKVTTLIIIFSSCTNSKIDNQINQDKLIKEARHLYGEKKYKEAKLIYNQILKNDSTNSEAFFNRGICNSKTDDFVGALLDYQRSVNLNYRIEDAYFNIACCYGAMEVYDRAIVYFKIVLLMDPNESNAKVELEKLNKLIASKSKRADVSL